MRKNNARKMYIKKTRILEASEDPYEIEHLYSYSRALIRGVLLTPWVLKFEGYSIKIKTSQYFYILFMRNNKK